MEKETGVYWTNRVTTLCDVVCTGERGLTVARIVECGNPDPVHEPSRREIAQAIYRMFERLANP